MICFQSIGYPILAIQSLQILEIHGQQAEYLCMRTKSFVLHRIAQKDMEEP